MSGVKLENFELNDSLITEVKSDSISTKPELDSIPVIKDKSNKMGNKEKDKQEQPIPNPNKKSKLDGKKED
jgi:hypothetical protein